LHFLSSEFLKDSQRKRRLALDKSRAALATRKTTISCPASASSIHLFTITYLMGAVLSSGLFFNLIVNYIYLSKICYIKGKQIDYTNIVKFNTKSEN